MYVFHLKNPLRIFFIFQITELINSELIFKEAEFAGPFNFLKKSVQCPKIEFVWELCPSIDHKIFSVNNSTNTTEVHIIASLDQNENRRFCLDLHKEKKEQLELKKIVNIAEKRFFRAAQFGNIPDLNKVNPTKYFTYPKLLYSFPVEQ